MKRWLEIIGDAVIIFCGLFLVYVFLTIEVLGIYGVEPNRFIRRFELGVGILILILGINRLLNDWRQR